MDAFFDAPNICNAHLCAASDNTILYTLHTTYSTLGSRPKRTRLEYPAPPPPRGAPLPPAAGEIDWRARTIALAGTVRPIDALKRHSGGFFSSTRAWRWAANMREYDISVDSGWGGSGEWTVRRAFAYTAWADCLSQAVPMGASAPVAGFRPAQPHLFRKSVPASVQISPSVPPEDALLLVLVFIYSEVRRQQKARNRRAQASSNSQFQMQMQMNSVNTASMGASGMGM